MKTLETHFLSRVETFCRKKARFSKGYENEDIFVYTKKDNKISLFKHYRTIGRGDGYAIDCLRCYYSTDENEHLKIMYKFGKMPFSWIPFLITFILGMVIWIALLCDFFSGYDMQWGGFVIASIFWIFGLFGLFGKSKKERESLEKLLFKICELDIAKLE